MTLSLSWFAAYLLLGAFSGFFAGLMGIGGGAVMVPLFTMLFTRQHFPSEHLFHLALGTSMATIVFTSIASARAHHRHGAVKWPVVRAFAPGILLGTLLSTQVAARIPTRPLAIFFSVFIAWVALQMFRGKQPAATRELPGPLAMTAVGAAIGAISALVAIGGGSMSVPFMVWCNVRMREAIATSAAIGFPIAVAGSIGYMIAGYGQQGLPEGSLGHIYLPALAATVVSSMLAAPFGARLAHRLPIPMLKRIFSFVLLVLAGKMIDSLFF